MTALYYAAKSGRRRVVKRPLERGMDARVRDWNRCTALDTAEFVGHAIVAIVLKEHLRGRGGSCGMYWWEYGVIGISG